MDDAAPSDDHGPQAAADRGGLGAVAASPGQDAGTVAWPVLRSVHGLADDLDAAPAGQADERCPFFYRRAPTPHDPGPAQRDGGSAARSPRRSGVALGVVLAVLLLAGTGIALAVLMLRGPGPGPGAGPGAGPSPGAAPVAGRDPVALSAAVNGRQAAMLDLVDGTTTVNLRAAPLGDELYRITTPAGSAVTPRTDDLGEKIRLALRPSGNDGPGEVNVLLNATVRWRLRLGGGSALSVIDFSGGRLAGLDLARGATRIELTLPQPEGTLRVRMTGGVNQFVVHTVGPVAVRVRVGRGAGKVVLDGHTRDGVAPGVLLTPDGWARSADRVDLDAAAGMGSLTVDEV